MRISTSHSSPVNRGGHAHIDFPLVTGPHAPLLGHVLTIRRPAHRVVGLGTDLVTDTPVVRGLIVVEVDRALIRRLAEAVAAAVFPDALERAVDHVVHALAAADRDEDALHRGAAGAGAWTAAGGLWEYWTTRAGCAYA